MLQRAVGRTVPPWVCPPSLGVFVGVLPSLHQALLVSSAQCGRASQRALQQPSSPISALWR